MWEEWCAVLTYIGIDHQIVSYPRDFLGPERTNLGQKQQNTPPHRPTGPEKNRALGYHILAEDKFPGEKEFVGAAMLA